MRVMHISNAVFFSHFKRALTSLAAIIAVTSIFAVKAAEWEKRAALEDHPAPRVAGLGS